MRQRNKIIICYSFLHLTVSTNDSMYIYTSTISCYTVICTYKLQNKKCEQNKNLSRNINGFCLNGFIDVIRFF